MCGILGIICNNIKNSNFDIKSSLNKLRNRGPNHQNFWINEKQNLLLGHTRLSIIDLSDNGNQPMLSFDKNKVIIFNGCIYNFKELANKFQIKIINSLTSDTRLLLELINKIGIKHALDEIEGMYSFALYDKIYNNIYLVNDRFGEKPIYIYFSDKHIFFSSELQAIKLLEPSRNFSIDKLSINEYLYKGYISAPRTIYSEIYKFKKSTLFEIDLDTLDLENNNINILNNFKKNNSYWEINNNKKNSKSINSKEFIENAKNITDNYIEKTIISDVNLGIFFSGGKDSTYILSKLSRISEKKIDTFTLKFDDENFDENYINNACKYFNVNKNIIDFNKNNLLNDIHLLPKVYSEPFSDPSALAVIKLSQQAKNSVKVIFTGDGGDEIFSGYKRHFFYKEVIERFDNTYINNFINFLLKTNINFLLAIIKSISSKYESNYIINNIDTIKSIFSNKNYNLDKYDLIVSKDIQVVNKVLLEQLYTSFSSINNFKDFLIREYNDYLISNILVKSDRACMYHSIENRSPFLNYKLVDFIFNLDKKDFNKNVNNKYILNYFFKRDNLKFKIKPKKQGFDAPIDYQLKYIYKSLFIELLNLKKNKEFLESFLDYENIILISRDYFEGKNNNSFFLWRIFILLIWKEYN